MVCAQVVLIDNMSADDYCILDTRFTIVQISTEYNCNDYWIRNIQLHVQNKIANIIRLLDWFGP
jgi:hypothetical protein